MVAAAPVAQVIPHAIPQVDLAPVCAVGDPAGRKHVDARDARARGGRPAEESVFTCRGSRCQAPVGREEQIARVIDG